MAKKLVVVLGAGASADSKANVVFPLSNDLFDITYDPFLSKYQRVNSIADHVRTKIKNGKNLEEVLKAYKNSSNMRDVLAAQEVILYLQDLIFSLDVNVKTSTKYHTLASKLDSSDYDQVLVLTLNFDTVFERAFNAWTQHDLNGFSELPAEAPRFEKFIFVKLHGSVNWGQLVKNDFAANARNTAARNINLFGAEIEVDKQILKVDNYQENCKVNNHLVFPAIAIPLEGKLDFVCPDTHIDESRSFIADAEDFLFIGFSGKDPHVIDLFKDAKKVNKLKIVNGDQKNRKDTSARFLLDELAKVNTDFKNKKDEDDRKMQQKEWQRKLDNENSGVIVIGGPNPHYSEIIFDGGFANFVDNSLESFLSF